MSRPPRKRTGNQKEIPPKKMLTPKVVADRLDITEDALAMRRQRKQGPPCNRFEQAASALSAR